jgi:hypothetical protein
VQKSTAGAAARRPRFFVANTIAAEPEYRHAWLAMGEYCVRLGGIDEAAVAGRIQGLSAAHPDEWPACQDIRQDIRAG